MHMDNLIRIKVQDFRAIKSADLNLNGITVVAGENGSGKSTVSKLLYHIFKTSIDFDQKAIYRIRRELMEIASFFDRLSKDFDLLGFEKQFEHNNWRGLVRELWFPEDVLSIQKEFNTFTELIIKFYQNRSSAIQEHSIELQTKRLISYLKSISPFFSGDGIINLLETLKLHINQTFEKYYDVIEYRDLSVWYDEFSRSFNSNPTLLKVNLEEYGVPIIDKENNRLSYVHSIQNVIYIDTPMILGIDDTHNFSHWSDLNNALRYRDEEYYTYGRKFGMLTDKILKGRVYYSEKNTFDDAFYYEREDGEIYDLLNCATGLKSFAIISLLYNNGLLNKHTLLIIDEPEAHLHPQWVVEYARLIVLLHKNYNIKFFIASHHPDMISAIRYISEKEDLLSILNFYLTETNKKDKYLYKYKSLGTEIDEIFKSFNIASERIQMYGGGE